MTYVIAYDIASPQRLQRVARFLERRALRCQKSVFIVHATTEQLQKLLDEVVPLIHLGEDCVQAWKLALDETVTGLYRGVVRPLEPACIVVSEGHLQIVENEGHA